MSDPIRDAVHDLFATRESNLRSASFAADASARSLIRRRRATRQVGTVAGVLVGVLALGAGAMAAVDHASQGSVDPIGVPTPTPTAVPETYESVYLVPDGIGQAMPTSQHLPRCDEPADFAPQSAHGLSLEIIEVTSTDRAGDFVLDVSFRNDSAEHLTFITRIIPTAIFVKDGIVASPPYVSFPELSSLNASPGSATEAGATIFFESYQTCVFMAAQNEFFAQQPSDDSSAADVDAWLAEGQKLESLSLEPGEYTVYVWTPVMFGTQAAAARVWREECVPDLMDPIGDEPTVEENELLYDSDGLPVTIDGLNVESRDTRCDILVETVTQQFTVPTSYINDYEPTYIISEPVTFTVE